MGALFNKTYNKHYIENNKNQETEKVDFYEFKIHTWRILTVVLQICFRFVIMVAQQFITSTSNRLPEEMQMHGEIRAFPTPFTSVPFHHEQSRGGGALEYQGG